ncbi:phosphodiester glycosidase family protein [Synechocystis sp. PCC 7509]|uniref:phosphodiester glycosidase family protein n=1 Tax=Synechocystis sp. PCC 7509 TaxID=927677 RepID=UPI0002AC30B7|nr:phosphodiester glycosidase family protein [Synechocystis sp. PCC 7509]
MVKGSSSFFPTPAKILLLLLPKVLELLLTGEVRSQMPLPTPTNKEILLNNRPLAIAWTQWQQAGKTHIGISDTGFAQILGVDLLNTNDPTKQPIQWFNEPKTNPIVLPTKLNGGYRYLDVTNFTPPGWQFAVKNNTLVITSPTAKIQDIRLGKQTFGDRIVIDLDRPTSWQVNQQSAPPKPKTVINELVEIVKTQVAKQVWLITIDGSANPAIAKTFTDSPSQKIETTPTLAKIRLNLPVGISPRVSTLTNPHRLVIDIRPDGMVEKNILWADGLRWRQQYVSLNEDRFSVTWLELNPAKNLKMLPFWSEATTLVGTNPLIKTAERYNAVAAINSGFFNRKNQLPLGAIRRDGNWISSPILNRGAIAWNNGKIKIGRLSIQESVLTNTGQTLAIKTFNSGYVQKGVARYSSVWGANYSPLTDNETIVIVQNNAVTAQLPGGVAGKANFPIPTNGYLLVVRGDNVSIPIGSILRLQSATIPADFAAYPHILAAGPVLIQNRQIVLDAKAEGFSDAFLREKAIRSAICTTASGNVLIAAVHNRVGGAGSTLAEVAKVMQQLGCTEALNFDGGSSTSLYLGGQLINRSPSTAARVHNGLGIFMTQP